MNAGQLQNNPPGDPAGIINQLVLSLSQNVERLVVNAIAKE